MRPRKADPRLAEWVAPQLMFLRNCAGLKNAKALSRNSEGLGKILDETKLGLCAGSGRLFDEL
jgi:hypothetical protein